MSIPRGPFGSDWAKCFHFQIRTSRYRLLTTTGAALGGLPKWGSAQVPSRKSIGEVHRGCRRKETFLPGALREYREAHHVREKDGDLSALCLHAASERWAGPSVVQRSKLGSELTCVSREADRISSKGLR